MGTLTNKRSNKNFRGYLELLENVKAEAQLDLLLICCRIFWLSLSFTWLTFDLAIIIVSFISLPLSAVSVPLPGLYETNDSLFLSL